MRILNVGAGAPVGNWLSEDAGDVPMESPASSPEEVLIRPPRQRWCHYLEVQEERAEAEARALSTKPGVVVPKSAHSAPTEIVDSTTTILTDCFDKEGAVESFQTKNGIWDLHQVKLL